MRFDTTSLPASERFAQWSRAVPRYDVSAPLGPALFAADVGIWMLGDLVITRNRLSPVRFVRSTEKIRTDGVDCYSLLLLTEASCFGAAGARAVTIKPGDLIALDLTQPMDIEGTAIDSITVQIPRAAVETRLTRVPDIHGRILNEPMGRLLAEHFIALIRQLPDVDMSDGATVASATLGLIALCFSAQPARVMPPGKAGDMSLTRRIKNYIDNHLTARGLSPARLCRELAVSRPALYRAFGGGPGIATYIRTRRLEAVHHLLTKPDERRTISAIAYKFGFNSEAHFSKVFRKRYGYSPRELRLEKSLTFRRLAAEVGSHAVVDTYLAWVREAEA